MALDAKVGSFAQPGSPGNQAITGLGFRPKVIIFFGNNRTEDGTHTGAVYHFGVGISSSDRRTVGLNSVDGYTTSAVGLGQTNIECIRVLTSAGAMIVEADFVSLDADGFTVNWTTADGTARIINYLALGGADLTDVITGSDTRPTTDTNKAVTGLGFRPDFVLVFASHSSASDPTLSGGNASGGFGGASATDERGYSGYRTRDNQGTSDTARRQLTNKVFAFPSNTGHFGECDLVSFDADGFTLSWVGSSSAAHFYYLAIKGPRFKVGSFTQKTSAGSQATSGVGFAPKALIVTSVNNVANAGTVDHQRFSLGTATAAAEEACIWFGDRDAEPDTISDSDLDSAAIIKMMTEGTPTIDAEADLTSFDGDGFTLNWSVADAVAREIIYIAIGNAAVSGGVTVVAALATATALSYSATITTGLVIIPAAVASATAKSYSATVTGAANIAAAVATATAKSYEATILAGDVIISAAVATASALAYAAVINPSVIITAALATATAKSYAVTVSGAALISAAVSTATAKANAAVINPGATIAGALATATARSFRATVQGVSGAIGSFTSRWFLRR